MKYIDTEANRIQAARKNFAAMAGTYCLGVFNDNFFKQAVLMLSVSAGLTHLQGIATALFALPFLLFSSCGGWLSDRFAKKKVVIGAKALEVAAMAVGAVGLLWGNWNCILGMVFLMGAQSAIFSPALNGAIPELYPAKYVPRANAMIKLITTLAILAGIALAGIALDQEWFATPYPFGNVLVGFGVVLVALLGFFASFGVYSNQAAARRTSFPWFGPLNSLADVYWISRDRGLLLAVIADAFFYFLASLAILGINMLGLGQLGLSQTATSFMSMSLMAGVCVGGLSAARVISMERWSRYLGISSAAMGGGLLLAAMTIHIEVSWQPVWLAVVLAATGVAGGLFLIPITSYLQVRPQPSTKGRVLAAANFCCFSAILLSGGVFDLLQRHLSPAGVMLVLALMAFSGACLFTILRIRERLKGRLLVAWLLRRLLSLRYRVEVKGLDELQLDESKGVVFLPNHPALIDPAIVMSQLMKRFSPRPLADADQAAKPVVRRVMQVVKPIILPALGKNGRRAGSRVRQALTQVVDALKAGEQILLYPAGRLYRSSHEDLAANSAVETIIESVPDVQVVLVRTSGLWGSSLSRAGGNEPSLLGCVKTYLAALLAGGLFWVPKRKVVVEMVRDRHVTTLDDRLEINAYLESFYNEKPLPNTFFPYYRWQGKEPVAMDEPETRPLQAGVEDVPALIREQVKEKLSEIVGRPVEEGEHLARDLALDSLTMMEYIAWLESEFGVALDDSSVLRTVDDCILAAGRQTVEKEAAACAGFAKTWFAGNAAEPLVFGQGATVTECFLRKVRNNRRRTLLVDQIAGSKSYGDIVTSILVLKPVLQKCQGRNLGIMLPPSVSAAPVYLATLFSGKTPVMYNWTTGMANMAHGVEVTGTRTIVTARALYRRIEEQQGVNLGALPVEWIFLEDIVQALTLGQKGLALLKSLVAMRSLEKATIPETAVILFTSGSESRPKAVPLTHENILTNMKDFSGLVRFHDDDRLLGMLPPFHSLGLMGTIILPLCSGLRTVYHTNPTESLTLAKIIEKGKVTLTIGTPTFINGILQAGTPKQLNSLRRVFTGAEQCPEGVEQLLTEKAPSAKLCEGYGITECSPLVSINDPDNVRKGTIGKVLPSIQYRLVHAESGDQVPPGEEGVLLVRGKSIFGGYIGLADSQGFRSINGDLWYDTGDLVREDEAGSLVFCGRLKRFIKLGGEMISLPAIESALLQGVAEPQGEGPVLAVETTAEEAHPEIILFTTMEVERQSANNLLREAGLSALHTIRRVIRLETIPLLGSGKTDYQSLKRLLAA